MEKKANEAKAKFAAMKKNFDDGKTALETEKATKVQYDKLPKDQQASPARAARSTSGR